MGLGRLGAAVLLLAIVISTGYSACVNLTDNSTWDGKIESLGTTSFWLRSDVTLCQGRYELGSRTIIFSSGHTEIKLDCNGSTIVGPGKVGGASGGVLFGCFSGNTYFTCSLNSAVRNCILESQNTAISSTNANGVTIENNTIRDVNYGISVNGAKNPVIRGNSVSGAVFDGMSIREGIGSWKTIGAEISGNNISGSGQYGLRLILTNSSTISRNRITGSGYYGIYLTYTNDNAIYDNYLGNARLSNSTDIWNIAKTPGTNIIGGPFLGGNYWSNYNGTDSDGDGLGNSPHSEKILGGDKGAPLVDQLPLVPYQGCPAGTTRCQNGACLADCSPPEPCLTKAIANRYKISDGLELPKALPYQNEVFLVEIAGAPEGGFAIKDGKVSSINCGNRSGNGTGRATFKAKIDSEKTIDDIVGSGDVLASLNEKMDSGKVRLEGLSITKKIKGFFTRIGLKIAGMFSKGRK